MTGIVLHIGIASREQMKARTLSVARGDFRPGPDDPKVWFASIESLAQILSTSNQRLLELIRRLKPQSMAELAKASGREESNLSRTLHTMERYRLVRLNKAARGRIVPEILYDRLTFDLPIAAGAAFAAAPAQPKRAYAR